MAEGHGGGVGKWIAGILATVISGVLLAVVLNGLDLGGDGDSNPGDAGSGAVFAPDWDPPPGSVKSTESEVDLDPDTGPLGSEVLLSARGFRPGEEVTITIHTSQVASYRADSNGELWQERLTIPSGAVCLQGQCEVIAQGQESLIWDIAVFTPTAGG
jgi:hypothetical protein